MRKQVRDFLTFTKLEKEGVFVFLLLILFICGMLYAMDWINWKANPNPEKIKAEFERIEKIFDSAHAENLKQKKAEKDAFYAQKSLEEDSLTAEIIEYKKFDPNEFTLELGESIGLSEKQSGSIINYINKGGQFRIKSDFKKMYVISDEKYADLENFISLPDDYSKDKKADFKKKYPDKKEDYKTYEPVYADINLADSATLVKVKGIGGYYAKSIVKYRNELGGYIKLEQLKEIYGMDEERYLALIPFLNLENPKPFRMINVNTITKDELKLHPYFDWNLTRSLINYRDNHGKFGALKDLQKLQLIDTNIYRKIAPYLTL
jgi:DNA uptake protein ComE-like DNA-binding protein